MRWERSENSGTSSQFQELGSMFYSATELQASHFPRSRAVSCRHQDTISAEPSASAAAHRRTHSHVADLSVRRNQTCSAQEQNKTKQSRAELSALLGTLAVEESIYENHCSFFFENRVDVCHLVYEPDSSDGYVGVLVGDHSCSVWVRVHQIK